MESPGSRGSLSADLAQVAFGVDAHAQEIVGTQVMPAKHSVSKAGQKLICQTPSQLGQVSADGAYDAKGVYEAAALRKARATVQPNLRGKKTKPTKAKWPRSDRERNMTRVEEIGLRAWKLESGYSLLSSQAALWR